jgi:transposase
MWVTTQEARMTTDLHDRVARGRDIATTPGQIHQVSPSLFSVNSQSGPGVYLVSHKKGKWECICSDFTGSRLNCKHILAVQIRSTGLTASEADKELSSRPRQTYSQAWVAYNEGRRAELGLFDSVLWELMVDVTDPTPIKQTGRPRLPLRDTLYCAVQKVYHDLDLRVAHGLNDRLCAAGQTTVARSRNMSSIIFRRPEVTPILQELISRAALPLASIEGTFAVDSSGFRTTAFGDYCREKYGAKTHNVWIKANIICGTTTHVVPWVTVTDGHAGDSPEFPGLVNETVDAGFVLREVYADKGYLSGLNYEAVRQVGGTAYIMFKKNSHGHGQLPARSPSPLWKKMWHFLQSNPTEFLQHYHKRENVESVFGAVKKRFGETIKSRDPVAQRNELLSKFLCWNVATLIHEAYEHGVGLPGSAREHRAPSQGARARDLVPTNSGHVLWKGVNN